MMDYKKLLKRYWIGIVLGALVFLWFYNRFEEPILMSVQTMAIVPDAEAAGSAAKGTIEGIFGMIGGAAGGMLQKVFR